jgi:chromosome segregation ATPase
MSIEREKLMALDRGSVSARQRLLNKNHGSNTEARLYKKYETFGKSVHIDKNNANKIADSKFKSPERQGNSGDKYGLQKLSDTWETRRSMHVKNIDSYSTSRHYAHSSPRVSYVRSNQMRARQIDHSQTTKRIAVDLSDEKNKQTEEDDIANLSGVDEVVENEKFYLVDSDHPIFLNSPSKLKKNIDNKDDIIDKYEAVLREINSEFKQSLRRNKTLEKRLEQDKFDRQADQHLISKLREENDYLRNNSREHNLTDVEREILNSEIAGLSYQLKVVKDTENKWVAEKANLQHSVHSYEISNQKLREQEARSAREVNVLIDKLNDRDNKDKNYDRLNAEVNAAKGSFQVWFYSFTLVYNYSLLIIFIYRMSLMLKEKKD